MKGKLMRNSFLRSICFIAVLSVLLCNLTTESFAMEASTNSDLSINKTEISTKAILYLNDWAEFNYGTSMRPLSTVMPRGNYTLYYSVTKTTTLILWHDAYTQSSFTLNGDGEMKIYVPFVCYSWQCISEYNNVSVSFVIQS